MAREVLGLTFREATQDDIERIAEIMASEPQPWTVKAAGSAERATALGYALVRHGPHGWQDTMLGTLDEVSVAVLQVGKIGGPDITPMIFWQALRIFGPIGVASRIPGLRAQQRVSAPPPSGSYYIRELHVHPKYRNRGLGGAMLEFAEAEARESGHRVMSLVTEITNPARRLYKRHGFCVAESRTDPTYERFTGSPGRLLMTKELW